MVSKTEPRVVQSRNPMENHLENHLENYLVCTHPSAFSWQLKPLISSINSVKFGCASNATWQTVAEEEIRWLSIANNRRMNRSLNIDLEEPKFWLIQTLVNHHRVRQVQVNLVYCQSIQDHLVRQFIAFSTRTHFTIQSSVLNEKLLIRSVIDRLSTIVSLSDYNH